MTIAANELEVNPAAAAMATAPPAVAPRRRAWLTIEELMAIKPLSKRRWRQICEEHAEEGWARLASEADGGKPRWELHYSVDTEVQSFVDQERAMAVARSLMGLTPEQEKKRHFVRETVSRWRDVLCQVRRDGKPEQTARKDFCAKIAAESGQKLTPMTLRNWEKAADSPEGFLDKRWSGGNRGKGRMDRRMLEEAERLFLLPEAMPKKKCFDAALLKAKENGWELYSYAQVCRYTEMLAPAKVIYCREGPDAFENKAVPWLERDYEGIAAGEIYAADHSLCDVICVVGKRFNRFSGRFESIYGRPWLTAVMDMRSRKIVGWVIRALEPNSDVIIVAYGRAFKSHGLPKVVYTDQGKDFECQVLTGETKAMRWKRRRFKAEHDLARIGGMLAELQIKHIRAQAFHGASKGFLERFFGTMQRDYSATFDTYTGPNPQEKPERLAAMLARGKAPLLADFIAGFETWLDAGYHHAVHTGEGMECTPQEAWDNTLERKRVMLDGVLELHMQRKIGPLKVHRNGVSYKGVNYGQFEINRLFGREVYIRVNDDDLTRVSVWTLEDEFVGFAPANRKIPMESNSELHRAAMAEKRRVSRVMRDAGEARLHIHEDLTETMLRVAQDRAAANRAAANGPRRDPPISTAVRSPLESQLERYEKALEARPMRQAVGAETIDLDRALKAFSRGEDDE